LPILLSFFIITAKNPGAEAMVLELNLYKMTLPQLTQYIQSKCSEYGTVKTLSVHLYPLTSGKDKPFALVDMSAPGENMKLKDAIGDGYFAGGITVNLKHKDLTA
jgi:hypothetical protein